MDKEKRLMKNKKGYISPLKSIRKYCIEICSAGNFKAPRYCEIKTCPLFPYRLGKHPFIRRKIGERKRNDGQFVPTLKVRNEQGSKTVSMSETNKIILEDLGIIITKIEKENE